MMRTGQPSPNPRLQRTRSASPPSPLSRQPLGVTKALLCVGLLVPLLSVLGASQQTRQGVRAFACSSRKLLVSADGERIQALEIQDGLGAIPWRVKHSERLVLGSCESGVGADNSSCRSRARRNHAVAS